MTDRAYYSDRLGRGPRANPSLDDVARRLKLTVDEMAQRDMLQEWYGYSCVDAGDVPGRAGVDLVMHIETVLGYRDAWPIRENWFDDMFRDAPDGARIPPDQLERVHEFHEDRVFDLIEFFHDHVSAGVEEPSRFHGYGQCGWHFENFDASPAQELFRTRMNAVLHNFRGGFHLSDSGQIERHAPDGLAPLLDTELRTSDDEIKRRVDAAIGTYRNRHRTVEDQRDAVRNLFDVLEKLKPLVQAHMLNGDENDLFQIANRFSIRHLNEVQKGNYDSPLWFSWMFYVNLATIHLIIRIQNRRQSK